MNQILIVGAGLAGLTAAYRLQQKGIRSVILEADDRPGGRVLSLPAKKGKGYLEMGPTWFGDKHQRLLNLIKALELDYFAQFESGKGIYQVMSFVAPQVFNIPEGQEPYYRFERGTQSLIEALFDALPQKNILFNTSVSAVELDEKGQAVQVHTADGQALMTDKLIITVPLPLVAQNITFAPALPPFLWHRFRETQTWMSDSIKFAVEYESPFWREAGFAGLLMSQNGPIKEMHDHCDQSITTFALMGFLHPHAAQMHTSERQIKVVQQIAQHFGPEALTPLGYQEVLWAQKPLTSQLGVQPMTLKPAYGHPDLQRPYWDNRLFFACAETDHIFGGYMEGAVSAAERVANQVGA